VDRASLQEAIESLGEDRNHYDVLPDRLIVYLWPYANSAEFDFKFRPRLGLKAKTAPSAVYDYYNPEARVVLPPVQFVVK
jgi:hypothetical protein